MKRKIRVIEFITSLTPGGAESIVKDYACLLNDNEFDVIVMTTAGKSNSEIEKTIIKNNIKTYFVGDFYCKLGFPGKVLSKLNRLNNIYRVIREEQPDIIHCHLGAVIFMAELCKRKAIKSKIVFTVHCELQRQLNAPGFRNAIDYLVKNNDMKIIALHERMRAELDSLYADKHIVLNNGTDLSRYNLPEDTREKIRIEFGVPQNALVVGHVGRFNTVKNHQFLISVFEEILRWKKNAYLVLIGDGETKKECMDRVKQLHLENNVIFTGNRGDIPKLLKMMDVFCLPSLTEGVPVTVVEAQAAGLPCVIADHIVDDVVVTEHVKRVSLNEPTEVWARIIVDSAEKKNSSSSSPKLKDFDMNVVVDKLGDYYKEIVNASK